MKKIYIQPDCQNIQVNVGKSMMAPYSYRGPFGSRGSDLFFWEDEILVEAVMTTSTMMKKIIKIDE